MRAPILVVDDHRPNLLAFDEALKDPRHELVLASSGHEAVEWVERREFAAILLDVRMPILSGYDTAALIRLRPHSKSTPILFMTAFDAPASEVSHAYAVGGTDFIRKPVDDVALRSKVSVFVDLYFQRLEAKEWGRELAETAERRLRLLFEQLPVNLCAVNRDLRITFADGVNVRAAGRAGSALIGRPVTELSDEGERPRIEEAFRSALEGRGSSYETHFEGRTYSAHVQPLLDREKAVVGAICGFFDVTGQRAAETRALEQKNLLDAFFRAASDAVFVKDASGKFLLINDAGARSFGTTAEEVVGKTDPDFLPEAVARACRESDRRVLESGKPLVTVEEIVRPDGVHTCRLSKAPLRNAEGKVTGVVGIAHDFTDLAKTQERLRLAMQATSEVIWDWDVRTGDVTWMGAVARLLDCETVPDPFPIERARTLWLEKLHPDDRSRVLESFQKALERGDKTWSMEYRHLRPDGRTPWMLDRALILRDASGAAVRVVGSLIEVTRQKESEEKLAQLNRDLESRIAERTRALRESQDRLKLALEGGEMGTWDWDTRTEEVHWSDTMTKILGYVPGETPPSLEAARSRVHPEDLDRVMAHVERAKGEGVPYVIDYRIRRADTGEVRWVSSRAQVVRDERGEVARLAGVYFDVTESKNAGITRALLADIVESSEDAMVTKNLDGVITSWNRGAERMYGYRPDEVIGRPITILIPEELRTEEDSILDRLRRGERIDHFETRRRAKDGRVLDVSLSVSPVRDSSGAVVGASKVARDISGRKRAEAALRAALEESSAFAHTVSHELRAPLRATAISAQLLLDEYASKPLDDSGREHLERILGATRRLDQMTQDLLSFSRLAGEPLSLCPVNVGEVVHEILEAMKEDLKQCRGRVDVQGDIPPVLASSPLLFHALSNLLYNAIKFVGPGTNPRVTVRSEIHADWVRLWVEDNGIGIDPAYQARLFQVFERLRPAEYPGTGIGLAIVRKSVERLGGKVGVLSQPGRGSRFWIEVPIAASQEPKATDPKSGPS